MRNIRDLESAFAELADQAPDPDVLSIPADASTRRNRRRLVLAPVAAAAATLVLVGGIVAANTGSGPTHAAGPSGTSPSQSASSSSPEDRAPGSLAPIEAAGRHETPDLTFHFTADSPGGVDTVKSRYIGNNSQSLTFRKPPNGEPCAQPKKGPFCSEVAEVTLHSARPSSDPNSVNFDPKRIVHRHPTQVNGVPAFYGTDELGFDDRERLYWQYAHDAWAEVDADDRSGELALAESVRPASEHLRVPVLAARDDDAEYIDWIEVEESTGGGIYHVASPDEKPLEYFVIWGRQVGKAALSDAGDNGETTVDGRIWKLGHGDGAEAVLKNSDLPLEIEDNDGTTVMDLEKLLRSLRVAPDLSDTSSWFDAGQLLD